MANRVIRDWSDSERIDQLSYQAEVLFTRLIMKADDHGSYFGNPKLIRGTLFPLRVDKIREADISRWMHELQTAGLIALYEADSKPYLRILNFGQRLRTMKGKYPSPPGSRNPLTNVSNCQQVAASGKQLSAGRRGLRPEEEEETEEETETEFENEGEDEENTDAVNDVHFVPEFVKREQKKTRALSEPFEFEEWFKHLRDNYEQSQLVEEIARRGKIEKPVVLSLLDDFYREKNALQKLPKDQADANTWILHWARKRNQSANTGSAPGKNSLTQKMATIDQAGEILNQRLKSGFYDNAD